MVQQLNEYHWQNVNLNQAGFGSSGGTMGFNSSSGSMSWYRKLLSIPQDYHERLRNYDLMDQHVEIARSLDIIAEDVSSMNADDQNILNIVYPEDTKHFRKTDINTLEIAKDNFVKRFGLDHCFFDHIRHTLKYGCKILFKKDDFGLVELENERFKGVVRSKDIHADVTHYVYDFGDQDVSSYLDNSWQKQKSNKNQNIYAIPKDRLVILKVGEGPFGESILDRVFKTWRRMQLLEDALVIYRVVRAPSRRVFYIDTGNLPPQKAESVVEQAKMKLRQRQISRKAQVENEFDPHSTTEDYFIPQSGQGRGSKIETLQEGGQGQDNLEDVKFFGKKLAMGLRVPPSMLDAHQDTNSQPTFNDMKVGQVYQTEMRYMGYVRRIQNKIAKELYRHFKEYCRQNEYSKFNQIDLEINPPQSFAVYKQNEVNQQILNVFQSADRIEKFSKRFSLKKYAQMDEDEIAINEYWILKEKGLTDETINKMEDHDRYMIVYGTPTSEVKEKYGLPTEERGGGGFGGF